MPISGETELESDWFLESSKKENSMQWIKSQGVLA